MTSKQGTDTWIKFVSFKYPSQSITHSQLMQEENITTAHNKDSEVRVASENELQGVAKVVHVLLMAYRNCAVYPEGHAISQKTLDRLLSNFNGFFSAYGHLRLNIDKEQMLYFDTVVHEAPPESQADDIIFQLYRDGIQWIEFQNGLELKELTALFRILSNYRSLAEETEGDIVTDLIDEDFSHISLEAIDLFWDETDLIDFSNLNKSVSALAEDEEPAELQDDEQPEGGRLTRAKKKKDDELQDTERPEGAMRPEEIVKSIADPSLSDTLWKLTPTEKELLENLVAKEENWDSSEDVFDVLMVILSSQENEQDFAAVLHFTMEEVIETLELKKFGSVLKLFQALHQLRDTNEENNWIKSHIERFFDDLSKPDTFDYIVTVLLKLDDRDKEQVQIIQQVLLYFSPETITMLGPLMLQSQSDDVQKMVEEVIEFLSTKDLNPLEELLAHPDEALGEKLLAILGRLQGKRAQKIFYAMLDHPSDKVRTMAIRNLTSNEPRNIKLLFPFIEDPYEPIQKEIFAWLSSQKSAQLETLLMAYMKKNLHHSDPDYILACYKALGHCGSSNSVAFLQRILLKNGWNSFTGIGKLIHRQGAACALALLDTWEAKDVLLKASNSKFPVVRQAFLESMAIINEPDGQTNE